MLTYLLVLYHVRLTAIITSDKFARVRLSACLSVSKITEKRVHGFE